VTPVNISVGGKGECRRARVRLFVDGVPGSQEVVPSELIKRGVGELRASAGPSSTQVWSPKMRAQRGQGPFGRAEGRVSPPFAPGRWTPRPTSAAKSIRTARCTSLGSGGEGFRDELDLHRADGHFGGEAGGDGVVKSSLEADEIGNVQTNETSAAFPAAPAVSSTCDRAWRATSRTCRPASGWTYRRAKGPGPRFPT
jgi:hypothetical protein